MTQLSARLTKLEAIRGARPEPRILAVTSFGPISPDEIDNFLNGQNVGYRLGIDQVAHINVRLSGSVDHHDASYGLPRISLSNITTRRAGARG